jgi:hypothetical protein
MEDLVIKILLGGGGIAAASYAVRHIVVAYIQRHRGRAMTIKGVDPKGREIELTFTDHTALEEAVLLESFTPQLISDVTVQSRTSDSGSSVS